MPFFVTNAILSLISIFGSIYFYNKINEKEQTIIELKKQINSWDDTKLRLKNEKIKEKEIALKMFNTYNPIFKKYGIRVATYIDGKVIEIKPPTFSQKVYDLRRSIQFGACDFLFKIHHDWLAYCVLPETGIPLPFVNRLP